jgi:3'5'-cyclic nucleotide phosphodiesterase
MDAPLHLLVGNKLMTRTAPLPADPRGSLPQIILNVEGLYEGTLIEYFQGLWYLGKNTNLPYHNFGHCTYVLWRCHEGARFHQKQLSKRRVRNLLIAALFHDYDHRGVMGNDTENIALAMNTLEELVLHVDKESLLDIKLLIRATEFPHVITHDELPLEGLILRDADMMQAFSPTWIQQVVFGLAAEWGKSPKEVLAMQKSFLGAVAFQTEWARLEIPDVVVALKVNEAEALLDILDMPAGSSLIREVQAA